MVRAAGSLPQLRGTNGFSTGTPVGSKCRTLRVTTVSPCSSAVAAISRSAPSWPRAPERRPHRRAVDRIDGENPFPVQHEHAVQPKRPIHGQTPDHGAAGGRFRARSRRWTPRSSTGPSSSEPKPHRTTSGLRSRLRSADNTSVSIRNIRKSTGREGKESRSNSSSSCGIASSRSANEGAFAFSR